jgi:FkbM family methyltransferase
VNAWSPEERSIKAAAQAALPSFIWTALRRLRLKWTLATFPRRIVQHEYAGFPLRLQISDPLAGDWYDKEWLEPPAIELLRRHSLREGAIVFNIGAHQGLIALILARLVGPSGRVVAVEAMSFNAAAAARNRDLNAAPQLTIVHAAVGENNGRLRFCPSLNGVMDPASSATGRMAVDSITIDELSRRYGYPDALFVDIEGFECNALIGATETLARRPDCVVEVHIGCGLERFGGSLERLLEFFPPDAYTLFMALDEKASQADHGFWPLDRADALVKGLFQLVAVGRR